MSTIATGNFPKALWPGVNTWYGDAYKMYQELWRQLYTVESSSKAYEEDVGYSGFGLVPIKTEGGGITYDSAMQGFITRYVHTTYGMGFAITREMVDDDQYGVIGKRKARALARSVSVTLNTLGAALYNNAATAAWKLADGVCLLNASHVKMAGGTFSNLSSSTLSESALESAVIAVRKWTDDRGLRINATPVKIIIPPDLEFSLARILDSVGRVESANNDINAIKSLGYFSQGYIVNPYITGTTSWYLQTDVPDGMKCYVRDEPEFSPADPDFDTENMRYKARFRVSFGCTDPRGLYGYDT